METLLHFLIEASTGIILFYAVYWLFLRQETFHKANRWFLLATLALSVILPVFPVHYAVFIETKNPATVFQALSETFRNAKTATSAPDEMNSEFYILQVLFWIYLTGAVIFLLRLLTQTLVLVHLILKQKIQTKEGVRIVENAKYGLPFSFFNIVFINPKFHTQENLPEILAHEKVHIRENHWFDLLIIELLTVIFWFNPFIWFFERSIKQNHEYLADQAVLSTGLGVGRYKALLVNQLMGMQIVGVTNNLNFALSTKRLKMMTKKKTPARGRIKFVWALPALALLLFAFAEPEYKTKSMNNEIAAVFIPDENAMKISGVILNENSDPLPGTSIIIKGTTTGTVSDKDGTFTLETPGKAEIVFSYVGKETLILNSNTFTPGKEKKIILKNGVFHIIPEKHFKGELPPPPPEVNGNELPPPPPSPAKGETFIIVEEVPQYQGGFAGLGNYVDEMQQKLAQEKNVSGKALIGFTVDENGKVTDVKILKQDNDLAGKMAALLVKEMKDWNPGKQRGKPVAVNMTLPVEF